MYPLLLGLAATLAVLLAAAFFEQRCRRRDIRLYPPLGDLIDVGGHRLHLLSKGAEGPTVVIEQGAGGPLWVGSLCSKKSPNSHAFAFMIARGINGAIPFQPRAPLKTASKISTPYS